MVVEVRDGILLKPVRRVDLEALRRALRSHVEKLREIPGRRGA